MSKDTNPGQSQTDWARVVVLLCCAVCGVWPLVPFVGLVMVYGAGQLGEVPVAAIWGGARIWGILGRTTVLATEVTLLSVLGGLAFYKACCHRPRSEQRLWLGLVAPACFLSPYWVTQGWIGLTGSAFSPLFSRAGVVAMLVLQFFPWVAVILYWVRAPLPRGFDDATILFRWNAWKRFWRVEWLRIGPALGIAGILTFQAAFWAYEIPSMLRQNLYALEVVAAFGSFYDYGRAVALLVPPLVLSLLLSMAAVCLFSSLPLLRREEEFTPEGNSLVAGMVLAAGMVFVWLIPLGGIVRSLPSVDRMGILMRESLGDLGNTLAVGTGTALVAMALGLGWVVALRLLRGKRNPASFVMGLALMGIALPGVFTGIFWIPVLGLPGLDIWPFRGLVRLLLVNGGMTVSYGLLGLGLFTRAWPERWTEEAHLAGLNLWQTFRHIMWPHLGCTLILAGLVVFSVAAREVPASLLVYPPGGSTLSLTIETMLHFEQPDRIATLCLLQVLLMVGVWTTGLAWIYRRGPHASS